MFETLVFLAVFVILGQMWVRIQSLERRLEATGIPGDTQWTPAPSAAPLEPGPTPAPSWWETGTVSGDDAPVSEPAADGRPEPAPTIPGEGGGLAAAAERPDTGLRREAEITGPEPDSAGTGEETPRGFGFEELFGRRLPIWAGGVTLAVAGVLIVRHSIEAGLLSPWVRFVAGLIFGVALLAAAELAFRFEERVRDPRVRQALAGAGIASLYASILVAVNLYALIGPMTAFAAMAAITALAMLLSLRFGAPSALLGLVGGLAAPALVGAGEPNVPLLTLYLGFAVGGLCVLSRAQRWMWLGAGALTGGLGWGLVLVLGGALGSADALSLGFYLLVVGIDLPSIALPSRSGKWFRIAGSLAAAAQMATLVATGGFGLLHWGLFGLISIALVWLSRREEAFERLPAVGLALVLLLAGAWPDPTAARFALVLLTAALVYGGSALHDLWRSKGGLVEVGMIAALSLGGTFLAAGRFYRFDHSTDLALAATALAAACFPAGAAMLGWRNAGRRDDRRFSLLVCSAALLAATAACFAIPIETLPLAIAALAGALLLLSLHSEDARIEPAAWAGAAVAIVMLAGAPDSGAEARRLLGFDAPVEAMMALLRWAGFAFAMLVFALHARLKLARGGAQAAVAIFAYGAAAQIVPMEYLSLVAPLALLAIAGAGRRLATRPLLPAMAVTLAISLCWTAAPLLLWTRVALESLAGDPFFVGGLPALRDSVQRLLVPALLIAGAAKAAAACIEPEARRAALAAALALAIVAAHILFKPIVGVATGADFVAYGLAERSLWEALLLGAAAAAWKLGSRPAAVALGGAALAHLGWYGLVLHNPLWAEQSVGPLPVLNLLSWTYGLPLALLALSGRIDARPIPRFERPRAAAQMLLIVLLAYSTLRQLVHGSILTAPGLSQGEDIARSILAVALAVGFLLWGMRTSLRDWRIGSLVLMLAAVAKVFLLDASGLEGLMRIASFVALGFSLIAIGWLYSRSLGGERLAESP